MTRLHQPSFCSILPGASHHGLPGIPLSCEVNSYFTYLPSQHSSRGLSPHNTQISQMLPHPHQPLLDLCTNIGCNTTSMLSNIMLKQRSHLTHTIPIYFSFFAKFRGTYESPSIIFLLGGDSGILLVPSSRKKAEVQKIALDISKDHLECGFHHCTLLFFGTQSLTSRNAGM